MLTDFIGVASIKWADAAKYWGEAATLSRTDGGMGLRELRLFFAQLGYIRVLFLALNYWASGPFTCLKFLKESGRKAWTAFCLSMSTILTIIPGHGKSARTFKMKHPMVILPLKKRRRRKKLHRSLLCHCKHCDVSMEGSYFVYV